MNWLFQFESQNDFAKMTLNRNDIHTLIDALPCLINNEFLSDVKFKFPDDQIIYGHSFIMCLRSDEFYEDFKATVGITKLIQVDDVSHEAFMEFIKYLYVDCIDISHVNIQDVIKLSIKYGMKELELLCLNNLKNDLDEDNVCQYLNQFLDEKPLEVQASCKEYIALNYSNVLNSPSFLDASENVLKCIISLDPVSDISEFKLFQSTIKWAIRRSCKTNEKEIVDGKALRVILGSNMKFIRFGAMSAEEFANAQKLAPGLLHNDECNAIFMNILTKATNSFGFSDQRRRKIVPFSLVSIDPNKNAVVYVPFSNYSLTKTTENDKLEKYFIEASVNKTIKVKQLKICILENCEIFITVYENKKEIFSRNIIKPEKKIHIDLPSITFHSRKLYRIQYELKVFNSENILKYQANSIVKHVKFSVENDNIEFKFYKINSQIRSITFDC